MVGGGGNREPPSEPDEGTRRVTGEWAVARTVHGAGLGPPAWGGPTQPPRGGVARPALLRRRRGAATAAAAAAPAAAPLVRPPAEEVPAPGSFFSHPHWATCPKQVCFPHEVARTDSASSPGRYPVRVGHLDGRQQWAGMPARGCAGTAATARSSCRHVAAGAESTRRFQQI